MPRTPADGGHAPALVVVTHDSRSELEANLVGQARTAEELRAPLVAVDNASADGTPELLRAAAREHPSLQVLEMTRNAGYAAAVNAGVEAAPGLDVLLVNPDVELPGAGPVRALAGFLERHPRLAVVGPRLVDGEGEPQPAARRFPSLLALIGSLPAGERLGPARRSHGEYLSPSASVEPVLVDWVIGAAMLIRRRAYDEVGGWDSRFFLYYEDADFCRRCARAGWEVAHVPTVSLRHAYARAGHPSRGGVGRSWASRRQLAGIVRLFAREPRLVFGGGRTPGGRL